MSARGVKPVDRVVHHPFIAAAVVVAAYLFAVVPDHSLVVMTLLLLVYLVLAVAPMALLIRHVSKRVCSACGVGVPQDPTKAAARTVSVLHLHHHPWRVIAVSGLLLAGVAALGALLVSSLVPWVAAVWMIAALMFAIVAFPMWVPHTHGRLAPWCPYCAHDDGWGDGGPEEPSPEPTPVPSSEARR